MKIVVRHEQQEEVEISFPHYRIQQNRWWFKILNENDLTIVEDCKDIFAIEKPGYLCAENAFHKDSVQITKEEFDVKFNEILEKIHASNK